MARSRLQDAWLGDRVRDLPTWRWSGLQPGRQAHFGVCRGLQLINVAFGGTLYQDIETVPRRPAAPQRHHLRPACLHEVDIVPTHAAGAAVPGRRRVTVNSIHHQGIKRLAPGFDIEAWSHPDGLPEAIRRQGGNGRGYIAATQWYLEFRSREGVTLDDMPLLRDFPGRLQPGVRGRPQPRPVADPRPRRAPAAPARAAAAPLMRNEIRR